MRAESFTKPLEWRVRMVVGWTISMIVSLYGCNMSYVHLAKFSKNCTCEQWLSRRVRSDRLIDECHKLLDNFGIYPLALLQIYHSETSK